MNVERDEDRRIIYRPGDVVGVANYNVLGKLAYNIFEPQTPLFHFLLIDDYLEDEDDYSIIESVAKGPTMGRLSWYAKRDYKVFRVNEEHVKFWTIFRNHALRQHASATPEHLGEWAVEKASRFGRHGYDFTLYVRLALGVLQFQVGRLVRFQKPRRMKPEDVPYSRDKAFVCTELVFEAWRAVGIELRAPGHAPLPCEFVLAEDRGELIRIDFHNGTQGQTWRSRQNGPPRLAECPRKAFPREACGMCSIKYVCDDPGRDDDVRLTVMEAIDQAKEGETILVDGGDVSILPKTEPTTVVNIPAEKLVEHKDKRDIIARQGGQKRNRIHLYRQPFGYPIRACDWTAVDVNTLETKAWSQGPEGPADLATCALALEYQANTGGNVCSHCLAYAQGKRTSIGGTNHGHGKGAA